MPPRFGTDGIRGVANTELTPEFALEVGRVAARKMAGRCWLVGRDTRLSGEMLQAALSVGLASEGREVIDVGVIPTPGLAWLAASRRFPAAMISASHNPFEDNGIKLFAADGTKISVESEAAIQGELDLRSAEGTVGGVAVSGVGGPFAGERVGRITLDPSAAAEYIERLVSVVAGAAMPNGEVVIDCAHGAASHIAPAVLERIGVRHHVMFCEPDGTNINARCGSTHLGPLIEEVLRRGAVLGIAFDGDADRMLAVDHLGGVVDGDHLIAMFAADLSRAGRLLGETVVVTVLSNLGLRVGLKSAGIDVVETPVGDRHVAEALETGGFVLGGEQSGHLIFRQHGSTGDGILTALKLLELLGRTGMPVADLSGLVMQRLPQVLINVPVAEPDRLAEAEAVWDEAGTVERQLGEGGRVLLRRSGTEACVRVMVEAGSHDAAERYAEQIAAVVRRELG